MKNVSVRTSRWSKQAWNSKVRFKTWKCSRMSIKTQVQDSTLVLRIDRSGSKRSTNLARESQLCKLSTSTISILKVALWQSMRSNPWSELKEQMASMTIPETMTLNNCFNSSGNTLTNKTKRSMKFLEWQVWFNLKQKILVLRPDCKTKCLTMLQQA
jgi:hypothetical protein